MFSLKATYMDGKLYLNEPLHLTRKVKVLVTVLDDDATKKFALPEVDYQNDEQLSDEMFKGLRTHERYRAKGHISLEELHEQYLYPLYDYSAGGLSFLSSFPFEAGRLVVASIADTDNHNSAILDFEFEVVRTLNVKGGYKVGCKFTDDVDEELWHSLMN